MDLRETRFALNDAVNSHDIAAIKTFVDPSYAAKGLGGVTVMGYEQMMDYAAGTFAKHPEYRETLEVEGEVIDGEVGRLTTRRTECRKGFLGAGRTNVSRQVETWKQVDGRWVIIEERAEVDPTLTTVLGHLKGLGNDRVTPKLSVGLLVASAVVLVASFLPWGSISARVNFGELPVPVNVFGDLRLTMTGWNGHLSVPGLTMPNWVVVLGAVAIAAFRGLSSASIWRAHPLLNVVIAVYGILHLALLAMMMLGNGGSLNIGLIATLAAYSAMLYILLKELAVGKKQTIPEI